MSFFIVYLRKNGEISIKKLYIKIHRMRYANSDETTALLDRPIIRRSYVTTHIINHHTWTEIVNKTIKLCH